MKGKRPVALTEMEPGRWRRLGRQGRERSAAGCASGWGGDGWLPPLPRR